MSTILGSNDIFTLHTDASMLGLGGVLRVVLNVVRTGEELLVAYYARQLRRVETNYSATELEPLAVLASVENFRHYLR